MNGTKEIHASNNAYHRLSPLYRKTKLHVIRPLKANNLCISPKHMMNRVKGNCPTISAGTYVSYSKSAIELEEIHTNQNKPLDSRLHIVFLKQSRPHNFRLKP